MDAILRPATPDDIPDLARLHLMAAHGFLDAVYHDAIPGLPTNEIVERVLSREGTISSYQNAWVAVHRGAIIGEIHAFPLSEVTNSPPNPLILPDRLALFEPMDRLDPLAAGTYYINIVATYPEYRGRGVGTRLLKLAGSHAQERGFSELSLITFEDDVRLVSMYQRLGFGVIGRSPVVKHELFRFSGDMVLMTRPVLNKWVTE